ncbi:MAG TPA: hypothetical protein DCL15_24720 [Chloroflexi bacterium]|nr:hypothetical protein [Chloroflexota bacterium]HHW87282.1 DUF4928 family protein [Chloroflexota bacterium]
MAPTSTSPIEATGVADPASYTISYLLTLLLEAADKRLPTMLRYLVAATLAVRYPDDVDSIHFRIRSRTEGSLGEQVDVLFNDAVFYVAAQPSDLDFAEMVSDANAGHIVYLLVPSEHETAFRQAVANERSGIDKRVNVTGVEQFIAMLLERMAKFDHSAALRQLRQVLTKYNELVTRDAHAPSLQIILPDFDLEADAHKANAGFTSI